MLKHLLVLLAFFPLVTFSQLWQNDFSNAADWINTDLNAGTDTWIIGTAGIGGDVDSISSASAGNGFAQFNSEGQCNAVHQDVVLTFYQPIDISANELSYLEFVQHYKRKSDTVYVEFSNDGLTWESIRINSSYWYFQKTQNPDTVQVSIPANVQVAPFWMRFRFSGECGYAWLMDDLKIFEKEQYTGKVYSEIQINSLQYFEINQCISDTLDLYVEIENFGFDTLFNVVLKTDVYKNALFDFGRLDTFQVIYPGELLDTLLSSVVTDPYYIETITLEQKYFSTDLDTLNQSNEIIINNTKTRQHDNVLIGYYYTDPEAISIGNMYFFSEDYCPAKIEVYIPNLPEAEDMLLFLLLGQIENGIFQYTGLTYDYLVTNSDLGNWITLLPEMNFSFTAGDTALVMFGTYGGAFPVPYANTSSHSQGYIENMITGFQELGNSPVFMMNLIPYDYNQCFKCNLGLEKLPIESLSIYPNPVLNEINFNNLSEDAKSIRIFLLDGREVYSDFEPQSETITISSLEAGTYLIFVETVQGFLYTERFIKL